MSTSLPLNHLAWYPPFLSSTSEDDGVLLNAPLSSLSSLRSLERFTPDHRKDLVDALLADLDRWDAPSGAIKAAKELSESNSYAVVTGQQAGIGGGPLYTLYKAIGTLCAAEELQRLNPDHRFISLFWIEGDDHDFQEIQTLTVIDHAGELQRLTYEDGDPRPRHVGDRRINSSGIEELLTGLQKALLPTEFTEEALALLRGSYRNEETLTDGFARTLYGLLGETPLVLLSSRNPGLKRLAAPIFSREAANPQTLFNAIEEQTEDLKARGVPIQITPKPGALFITDEGERRHLDLVEGGYSVRGSDRRFTFESATELALETPEIFSPNVALRPLVQDVILPTAIYLGGPGELAYLHQLRRAYHGFKLEPSAIAPRPFVLLLEPKVVRTLEKPGLALERVLEKDFSAAGFLVDEQLEKELERGREEALKGIDEAWRSMEAITGKIDPTLSKALGAGIANSGKEIENLSRKLRTSLKKREQTEIDRLNGARIMLLPGEALQERTLNAIYFINKFGIARFRAALASIELIPGVMQVIEL